ncbi:hypothetical protein HYPGJ_20527 [Hyphomicrobium sp. GJ21]|nr:hypothetical protein HYPGJ_20527 [Hyphomicrobium sp. GJ21]
MTSRVLVAPLIKNQKSKIKNQKSKIKNQKSKIQTLKPKAQPHIQEFAAAPLHPSP